MKRYIYIITLLLLLVNSIEIKGQENIPANLVLNQPLNSGSYNYTASQSISLANGFQYTANADNKFLAFINLHNLDPNPYPNSITGGSGNGIVGTLEGDFNVTPAGQAIYEIPIKVPAGTGGIAPQLSIVYNSASGDGLLGNRFELSGLSMINRTPANMHIDGYPGVVNFTGSDKFMIDGQRLIYLRKIDDQTREYRTENNTFMKVIAKGDDPVNPSSFIVYSKDGLIYEYGSNNSQLKSQGENSSINLFWLIRKVSDTKGNYYIVTYDKNEASGEYWPTRIDYTGNSNTGLVPYCSVRFTYHTREYYPELFYIHGMMVRKSKLLKRIDVYSAEKRIKYYELDYYNSDVWKYQLTQVTEYAADGIKINPTKFDWGTTSLSDLNSRSSGRIDGFNRNKIRIGDFNGDGRMDLLLFTHEKFEIWLFTDSGFKLGTSGEFVRIGPVENVIIGDFNGDGCSDFATIDGAGSSNFVRMYITNIYGDLSLNCYHQGTVHDSWMKKPEVKAGDFNGDGATDLFVYYPYGSSKSNTADVICSESTKNGITALNKKVEATGSYYWDRVEIVDFNGDGRAEIMNLHPDGYTVMETLPQELYFHEFVKNPGTPKKNHHLHFGDFNGDGKTDMLITGHNDGDSHWSTWEIHLSRGNNTFETIYTTQQVDTRKKTIYIADANGDGKDDIFAFDNSSDNSSKEAFVRINKGINIGGAYFAKYNISCDQSTDKSTFYFGDFNGNGRVRFIWAYNGHENNYVVYGGGGFSGELNNLLTSITDGLGNFIKIEYKPMTDNAIHERGRLNTYPMTSFSSSMPLVSKVGLSNGIGGESVTSYKYKNALMHKRGRGFLGFEYVVTTDETNNIETTTQLNINREQYVTGIKYTETKVNGKLLSRVNYTNQLKYYNSTEAYNKIFTYDVISSSENKYEINTPSQFSSSSLISTVTSTAEYDNYGNVTKSVIKYSSSDIITSTNTYTNDENKWYLGRLTKAVVTKEKGSVKSTKTSEFSYDPVCGMLNREAVEPSDNLLGYVKTYEHDDYGNILVSTTTPNDTRFKPRVQKSEYDSKGRFEVKSINILNDNGTIREFVTERNINYDLGVVNYEISPNGVKTEYIYDSFGQLIFVKTPLGNAQTITRWSQGHSDAPANAIYFVYSEKSGAPPALEFFDRLGRSLRKVITGFAGQKIYTDVIYNAKGQVEKASEPYFAGQTIYWNKNEYDAVGRTIKQIYPDNTYSQMIYDGLTTSTISPLGHRDTKKSDVFGNIVGSIDNEGGKVLYEFDVDGNCIRVTGPRTVIKTEFDRMGNRIKLDDPDLGVVTYVYNAFGELILQTDANGTKTIEYDNLGRVVKETNRDDVTTYLYDTKWKGSLTESKLNRNNISQKFDYDEYGRIKSVTETIDNKTYTTYTSYDIYNRVDVVTYPSGFKVQNEYNGNSYLVKVKNQQNGKVYWHAKVMNARGQLEQFTLGNNLTTTVNYNVQKGYITDIVTPGIQNWTYKFNSVGNLTERLDNAKGLVERFNYDGLNRLSVIYHNNILNQDIRYDAAGNVIYKTGVGTYFKYKDGTNKLEYVTGSNYTPPSWDVIMYTPHNKIYYVSQGSNSLAITYGVNKERKKAVTIRNGITDTKYYVGSLYEEQYLANEVKKIHYIFAGGSAIAISEQSNTNGEKLRYLHKDHLGSIQAYSNEAGTLVEELSYDAWGRRRDANTWQYISLTNANVWHPRGFTGHEHIDMFEMINMNGRMYDPVLGRFLSPDPYVQAPDYTQGLNRYAYCLNNPLSLVDPSGYSWFSKHWKSLVSAVVGITVAAVMPGVGLTAMIIAGAAGGAAAGLTGALLNGANIGQLAKSTITGGFWGAVGGFFARASADGHFLERLFKHSFSQGWLEGVKGGNFVHGFMSGAASVGGGEIVGKYGEKWSKAVKVAFNAAVGGTVAQLGGGKFANGAITAAYIMLFNHLHEDVKPIAKLTASELEAITVIASCHKGDASLILQLAGNTLVGLTIAGSVDFMPVSLANFVRSLGLVYEATKGLTIVLAGTHAGNVYRDYSLSAGVGSSDLTVNVSVTTHFYSGKMSTFKIDNLQGETFNIGGGISVLKFLSIEAGFGFSRGSYGNVYSLNSKIGLTKQGSLYDISIGYERNWFY